MTFGTSEVESVLGVDLDDLEWQDMAVCKGVKTNKFYDDYESDIQTAYTIDQMCLSCPVMRECLMQGMDNGEWGVWGGIYLTSGKPDDNKNSHKTDEVREEMAERLAS